MKTWQKYKEHLFLGEWHIHTNFTDGKSSVSDYVTAAKELEIPLLAFTEHVRLNLTYDFEELLAEIEIANQRNPELIILSGCEAKVLPDGTLDCSDRIFNQVDHKMFAFHEFPKDAKIYYKALSSVIQNYHVDCWAHPGLFFEKVPVGLDMNSLGNVFKEMWQREIIIEINLKYQLPKHEWVADYLKKTSEGKITIGGDVHSVDDLHLSWKTKQQWLQSCEENPGLQKDRGEFLRWMTGNRQNNN